MNTSDKYIPRMSGHAVVLGGSGGIGKEIVRAFVAQGIAAVSFTYGRNKAVAEELRNEIVALGVQCFIAPLVRLEERGVTQFLEDAVAAVGVEVNMMVDTVGISPNTHHEQQTVDEWRQVFETNVIGSFLALRETAERMKAKQVAGSIVLITSTNGVNSQASYSSHYDASKAAQAHMMRTLAETYAASGIRINSVAPGWVATTMNNSLPDGEYEKETAKIWLKRFAHPHEIANIVTFLCSSGATYIVGQNIMVDGGYR